jgi:hypothetical protein
MLEFDNKNFSKSTPPTEELCIFLFSDMGIKRQDRFCPKPYPRQNKELFYLIRFLFSAASFGIPKLAALNRRPQERKQSIIRIWNLQCASVKFKTMLFSNKKNPFNCIYLYGFTILSPPTLWDQSAPSHMHQGSGTKNKVLNVQFFFLNFKTIM